LYLLEWQYAESEHARGEILKTGGAATVLKGEGGGGVSRFEKSTAFVGLSGTGEKGVTKRGREKKYKCQDFVE